MASTSIDSMWRRFDENRTRHDEFQRSLEELKDMMRTLLAMETGSSSIIRSVPIPPHRSPAPTIAPIPVPPNPPMCGVSQADMRFAEEDMETGPLNQDLQGISTSLTPMGGGHTQVSSPEIVVPVEDATPEVVTSKNELLQQPFEETRNQPTPIDLEMDSHGANPAGPHVLDAPIEAERNSGAALADEDINRIQEDIPLVPNLDRYPQHLKVTLDPLEGDMLKLVDNWKDSIDVDSIDVRLGEFQLNSVNFLVKFSAHKVFVKMPEKNLIDADETLALLHVLGDFYASIDSCSSFVFDPGKGFAFPLHIESAIDDFIEVLTTLGDAFSSVQSRFFFPFDPGKWCICVVCCFWASVEEFAKLVLCLLLMFC